jgi:phosphatidate cytidylyltransferase
MNYPVMSSPELHSAPMPKSRRPVRIGQVGQDTLLRVASAFILLPLVVFGVLNGGWLFTVIVCFFFLIGSLELITILRHGHTDIISWVGTALALVIALTFGYASRPVWLVVLTLSGLALFILHRVQNPTTSLRSSLLLTAATLTFAHVGGYAILLRNDEGGLLWWILILIGTWMTDTLAFAGGRAYGKTPLLASWSPKKTLEGTLTGIIGSILLGLVLLWYAQALHPLLITIVVGAPFAAVIGDLLESRLKRAYHVKDSYVKGLNIMPGHGGILDRIDSLCAVIVFVFAMVRLFA